MPLDVDKSRPDAGLSDDLKDPAYLRIRDIIYAASGIYQPDEKLYLLAERSHRRMNAVGVRTVRDYHHLLTTSPTRDAELRLLLNEITIGETYMFRAPAQLEALRKVILPQLIEARGKSGVKRIRVWSAGCSTGEEPYTLAMFFLEESCRLLDGWSVEIVATDLNDNSIHAAEAGLYGDYAMKNTPEPMRRKYFRPEGSKFQASDELRERIQFRRLNMKDDAKMLFMKGMDIIFCCNVLIYFDKASKSRVVKHFFANLIHGGYLFLGNAESLYQMNDDFHLVHFPGVTGYWKPSLNFAAKGKP
ncbi:MAG: protein-glutamate O-methyltransferase CheR [Candidatus Acidiferrales bacterium]